jgi:hypothetical protein
MATGATVGTALVELDVYGLSVAISSDWGEVLGAVRGDFAWFERPPAGAQLNLVIERRSPEFSDFSDLKPAFVTPRNVVYQSGDRTVIDYFGSALSIYDRSRNRLLIQGEHPHLVHEASYHFLLSRIGEHLDAIRMPRLHALGLSGADGAVAVLLPGGGGKSTLALRALRDDRARLLSDDSPLIDRRGRLHPFPLRVGVNPEQADDLPPGNVREMERMELHPKLLLDIDPYRDRIERDPQPLRHIVIGERSLGPEARLERVPRRAAFGPLLREAVIGVGLYQGMEFVLQHGAIDVARQVKPALVRARCCAAGLARSTAWRLILGRDHERNWEALLRLVA